MDSFLSDYSNDDSSVIRFLNEYAEFSSRGHLVSAKALLSAIVATQDQTERKILSVKVFAEFISAIEDLGAFCIAIRHREAQFGLIHAYMTYNMSDAVKAPKTNLKTIFELLKQGDGLEKALRLPSINRIKDYIAENEYPFVSQIYIECNRVLSIAGRNFFSGDRILVDIYNKTKHGFIVSRDPHLLYDLPPDIEVDTAWIMTYEKSQPSDDVPFQPCPEYNNVTVSKIDEMVEQIAFMQSAAYSLCKLIILLLRYNAIIATEYDWSESLADNSGR